MDWMQRIGGCFGTADGLFANHPLDEDRAFQLLRIMRENGVGWEQAREAFRKYMEDNSFGADIVEEQMASIERHMKPWLR